LTHSRANRVLRVAGGTLIAAVALFCLALLVVRFFIFPRIDSYRDEIAARLSAELDAGVEIAAIDTGWDGWNPKLSVRGLTIHDRKEPRAPPVLELPRVDLVVAWTSIPLLDLRLEQLTIHGPQLAVRRDSAGRLYLAGVEIDQTARDGDTRLADWLLRQPELVVRDALVTWTDELRGASELVLEDVQLQLEQSFGRHRFGLRAKAPANLAAPLDVRGDITGLSLAEWRTAKGNVYVRVDYTDVALWQEWISLPIAVNSGKGALRLWLEFESGKPREIVADLDLADVRTKLKEDLSPLEIARVSGRLGWKDHPETREIWTQRLTVQVLDTAMPTPVELRLTLNEATDGSVTGGRASFDQLEIESLAAVTPHLPIPETWQHSLRQIVRGSIADARYEWKGPLATPATFAASGKLKSLAIAPQDGVLQVSGITGAITANEAGGEIKIDSRDVVLALPRTFTDPLAFTTAGGRVQWDKTGGEWRVRFDDLRFANAHTSGRLAGSWRSHAKKGGAVDIAAELTRLDLAHLDRYLPLELHPVTRDWLRLGIKQGVARDLRLAISGNLADFPFPDNRGGRFAATLNVADATLAYGDAWPEINAIDAEVKFEGARVTINAARGQIFGAQVGPVVAQIADTTVTHPRLTLTGEATGPTSDFLRFITNSPLASVIGPFSDSAKAVGNGALKLSFALPLGQQGTANVTGEFRFLDNEIRLPGLPELTQVKGQLTFSEQGVSAQNLTLETLGGPATLRFESGEDGVRVTAAGTASLVQTKAYFDMPLLHRMSGNAPWQLSAITRPEFATWMLESDLRGVAVDLPAPLGKTAAMAAPLKIERRAVAGKPDEDTLSVDYAGPLRLVAHRRLAGGVPTVDRALLLLGDAVARGGAAERPGIWVRGQLAAFDVDEWLTLRWNETSNEGAVAAERSDALKLQGVDIDVARLGLFGRVVNDLKLSARRASDDWRLTLNGREIEGTANWRGRSTALPNGRVQARLARLTPPGNGEQRQQRGDAVTGPNSESTNTWPELDIVAERFVSDGRNLGKLELVAQPAGPEWRITKLALVNDAGRLDATGSWRASGARQQTELEVALSAEDAGAYLARLGLPDSIKNAATTIAGRLAWSGAPNEFDYPTLTGTLRLQSGAGQFTKIDPGIGKLLGVLSLQALPRRITLDFRDVFSDGFAFDEITADLQIRNGTMHTDDLRLSGPAAKVTITGDIDLAQETQRLSVRVQPALSSTISAGAAVLFLANPLVGAAVGAGTLLAQKVLRDPIEQLFSYDYRITGSWSDPIVERGGPRAASRNPTPAPGTAGETTQ